MGREVLADGHKPTQLPALLISRLCLTAECLPPGGNPGAIPGDRTTFFAGCASARGRVSKTQIVAVRQHLRAARRQPAIFIWGSWQTRSLRTATIDASKAIGRVQTHPPTPPSFAWNPSNARGSSEDVLQRLGEGGLSTAGVPSYGWQAIACFTR